MRNKLPADQILELIKTDLRDALRRQRERAPGEDIRFLDGLVAGLTAALMAFESDTTEGTGFTVGRKHYDASLPWHKDHVEAMKKVKRKWSLGGVTFHPTKPEHHEVLKKVFGSATTEGNEGNTP